MWDCSPLRLIQRGATHVMMVTHTFNNAQPTIKYYCAERRCGVMTRSRNSWIVTVWSILHQPCTWKEPPIASELITKHLWPPGVFCDCVKHNSGGLGFIHQFICVIDRRMRKGGAE
jgi:hypothetical protein